MVWSYKRLLYIQAQSQLTIAWHKFLEIVILDNKEM